MRILFAALLLLFTTEVIMGQEKGNYILVINKDSLKVALDQDYAYTTPSGEEVSLKIVQPNILTYSDEMISFKYDKSNSVSNTAIEKGIAQCMILKSTGNGFIVQKYENMNPSSLTQFMLSEITKESISYGYTMEQKTFKKELQGGQQLEGVEAILTYKGEKEVYTVATYGHKDQGIIVITMLLSEDFVAADKPMIDLFLNSLQVKIPSLD
ncbi:hypothetical protein [Spongiimicrobium salis]|uniref:hypothetical protein n=1 Tax=Spongiimicrobium salis TaxID=1667022 RepID=UPI00374DBD54